MIETTDTEMNHQLAFLSKINKLRAILSKTFNIYQDQFQIFLENEDLLNDFPVLYLFINAIFFFARKQAVHEFFLQKHANNRLGNTFDNEFENSDFSVDNNFLPLGNNTHNMKITLLLTYYP